MTPKHHATKRHARHEECIKTKFHIFYISVTGTPQLELLAWGSHHNSTEVRSHNAWWNRRWVGPNNSLDFTTNNLSPAGKCTMNINPTANNFWMDNSSSLIYIQQDSFLHDFLWNFSKQQIYITGTCDLVNETNLVHKILSIFHQFYL
jgi:hypothetical protein